MVWSGIVRAGRIQRLRKKWKEICMTEQYSRQARRDNTELMLQIKPVELGIQYPQSRIVLGRNIGTRLYLGLPELEPVIFVEKVKG